ncbi:response regulator [Myxococcota bacterium]|nr:response regulator [Myxococcota bacterium]MBU1535689.1 response regulator [Myxococcota bacterium]
MLQLQESPVQKFTSMGMRVLFLVPIPCLILSSWRQGKPSWAFSLGLILFSTFVWAIWEFLFYSLRQRLLRARRALVGCNHMMKKLQTCIFLVHDSEVFHLGGAMWEECPEHLPKQISGVSTLLSAYPFLKHSLQCALSGQPMDETVIFGDHFFEVVCHPMSSGGSSRPCILCMIRNITFLKKSQDERSYFAKRLEQAGRMEALGTLAGGFAHDFNNIIFSAIGFTEMAMEQTSTDTKLHTCLTQISLSCSRAKELVEQISLFSGRSMGEKQRLRLHPLIKSLAKRIVRDHSVRVKLRFYLDEETPPVFMDPTAMHLVLFHVIDNAVRSMDEEGGALTCTLSLVGGSHGDTQDRVKITIKDTGCGMNEETRKRIFDPYFTTRPPGEGMGLGLATAYGILSQNGGWTEVESVPREGTTFTFYLPPCSTEHCETEEPLSTDNPRGTEHILVVDDEPQIETLLRITLESLGYRVTSTTKPQQALADLTQSLQSFDLLVTDRVMPGITGEELTALVNKMAPDFPVLMLTGQGFVAPPTGGNSPHFDLLYKPTRKKELAHKVRALLDKGTHGTDTPH